MKSLNEDLKTGQFKQIYLLYGEEAYLKKLYKNRFVKAMVPEGDTMNYRYFEERTRTRRRLSTLPRHYLFCRAQADRSGKYRFSEKCDTGAGRISEEHAGDHLYDLCGIRAG